MRVYHYRLELIDALAAATGREPKRKTVPLPMLRCMATVAGVFDGATGRKLKTAYASATAAAPFDFASVASRFPIAWTTIQTWAEQHYGDRPGN